MYAGAALATQRCCCVFQAGDDGSTADAGKGHGSLHLGQHAAGCEMTLTAVLLGLGHGHLFQRLLVGLAPVDGNTIHSGQNDQHISADQFCQLGGGKVLVDNGRSADQTTVLGNHGDTTAADGNDNMAALHQRADHILFYNVNQEGLSIAETLDDHHVHLVDFLVLCQLVEQVNHALVAAGHGLPVVLDGLAAEGAQRIVEALNANVDDAGLGVEQFHDRIAGNGQGIGVLAGVGKDFTVSLGEVDALQLQSQTDSAGVAGLNQNTALLQSSNGLVVVLRIVLGTADGTDEIQLAAFSLGLLQRLTDDGSQSSSHIGVAAVAQHAVQQDDAGIFLSGALADLLDADFRVDRVLDGDRADLLVQVTAAGADSVHNAAAQTVDNSGDFLNAGAAVGTHEQQALLVSLLLQADLVFQSNVIGEGEHVQTHVQCALDLGSGVLTGSGEQCQVGIGQDSSGLGPAGSFLQGITGFGVAVAVGAPLLVGIGVAPIWAVLIPLIGHSWANTFGTLAVAWDALVSSANLTADPVLLRTALWTGIFIWIWNIILGTTTAGILGKEGLVLKKVLPITVIAAVIVGGVLFITQVVM